MDFRLTPEHEKIREVSRKLAADFATRAARHDQETSLPVENYAALKREGVYALTAPKNLNNSTLDGKCWDHGFLLILVGCSDRGTFPSMWFYLGGWGAGFLGWTLAAEELAQGCPGATASARTVEEEDV